jgi:hypothetical protein
VSKIIPRSQNTEKICPSLPQTGLILKYSHPEKFFLLKVAPKVTAGCSFFLAKLEFGLKNQATGKYRLIGMQKRTGASLHLQPDRKGDDHDSFGSIEKTLGLSQGLE